MLILNISLYEIQGFPTLGAILSPKLLQKNSIKNIYISFFSPSQGPGLMAGPAQLVELIVKCTVLASVLPHMTQEKMIFWFN